jgi:hypothetical protein
MISEWKKLDAWLEEMRTVPTPTTAGPAEGGR